MRILFILCLLTAPAWAGVYKWVDADGRIHFSDRPVENAEALRVPGAPLSRPSAKTAASADASAPMSDAAEPESVTGAGGYTLFELVNPEPNQTFRNDDGQVPVSMLLQPGLQPGHQVHLSLNGTPVEGRFVTTHVLLNKLPRGTHRLRAQVLDEQGRVLISTQEIYFHLRRAAEGTAPSPAN